MTWLAIAVATQRRLEASAPLLELPPNTPVTLVSWQSKEQDPTGWYDPDLNSVGARLCPCFDQGYDRPYRGDSRYDY